MATQYSCELCNKNFNQKIDLTRHKNKKSPCISLDDLKKISNESGVRDTKKSNLVSLFKSCLNILRDNEGLTGAKALNNLTYLLTLKLIEPHLDGEIDIKNYEYENNCFADDVLEESRNVLFNIMRFSNLVNENEINVKARLECLWDYILSQHPSTKNIFLKNKHFDISHSKTYIKLIKKIDSFDLKTDHDILGGAYEEVIQNMAGKELGQFFTPSMVKKIAIDLITPTVFQDGKIKTCCDLTMGTGGFLITYINKIIEIANNKKINLDWNFIKTEGLYGKEIDSDIYQLAVANMLISTGHMFENLDIGDSIRKPITKQFDYVLANPPFGIKGLDYDTIHNTFKKKYTPIKSNNAVSLFLQAIISILKINGEAVVVLPDGQDFFSKASTYVAVREYLMKTCDLKQILYLPSGIFTNTSIKTCIIHFVKKRNGDDVLTVTNTSKSQNNKYTFSKTTKTVKVKFYDMNPYENIKNLLVEVPIKKIADNSYSLNYAEYMKEELNEDKYDDDVVVKTLGEVCEKIKGNKQRSKNGKDKGLYPLYYCSILKNLYLDTFDYIGEGIIINKTNGSGRSMVYYGSNKYNVGESTIHFKSKIDGLQTKYIYYYLLHNIKLLEKYYKGANQKSIIEKDLFKIKIPIPSLERQKEIVEYLDFIEKTNKTSNDKIAELKQLNKFHLTNQKIFGENIVNTLGEVCKFKNGKGIKKDILIKGEYPVIGGGQKPMGFHNEYNTNENTILCSSSGAYAGFISKYDKKVWASDCFSIIPKENTIDNNYLYYLLKITQDKIYKSQTGTAQPHIYSKDLQNLKIPIPSLERQKEIVKYCEYNDTLIKQLEQEIQNNKNQAKVFMINALKQINNNDQDDSDEDASTDDQDDSDEDASTDGDQDDSDEDASTDDDQDDSDEDVS